jgi:glycosyltransferase involved in cell wall biosynthesis
MAATICVVGGIFNKPASYRAKHSVSPETLLVDGLKAQGARVVGVGRVLPADIDSFDLVHVHHFGRAALQVASIKRRARFVFTPHDGFSMNGRPVPLKRRLTDAHVMRMADHVVALSQGEKDFIVERYGIPAANVTAIPNGVDGGVFRPVASESGGPGVSLLSVGQLEEFKGTGSLIRALPRIRRYEPSVTLTLVYQSGSLEATYRQLAEECGVRDCVFFVGPKTPFELRELYCSTSIFVSPSLVECLSTVVTEAMFCGAAIVATDVGAIREQLDESCGVIVPASNPDALAIAIAKLLRDPAERRRLGAAARAKATSKFAVEAMIGQHVRVYQRLMEEEGVPASHWGLGLLFRMLAHQI